MTRSPGSDVAPGEAIADIAAGTGWLLDVREPDEWRRGHAPGAHHIPMGELGARQHELPADAAIYVVCHSGARSRIVVDALTDADYPAVNVAEGMVGWHRAGGEVIAESGDN